MQVSTGENCMLQVMKNAVMHELFIPFSSIVMLFIDGHFSTQNCGQSMVLHLLPCS
jgi:hypothetical protein